MPRTSEAPRVPVAKPPPKVALVLGGGGTRGFSHIGVIKQLEAQGIVPSIIVGTSAGSVVGALYARGYSSLELHQIALNMEEEHVIDLAWLNYKPVSLILNPIDGSALEQFINRNVQNFPLEKLPRKFAAVATDLHSGEMIVFERGDTGRAVRASSSVPGVFRPVGINGRYYVDGGLVRPVPVSVARSLGADFVVAVDISSNPTDTQVKDRVGELLQTFNIMIKTINQYELSGADIVIRPQTSSIDQTTLNGRHQAVLEGEKAARDKLPELRSKLNRLQE
jgi:NTE family protein